MELTIGQHPGIGDMVGLLQDLPVRMIRSRKQPHIVVVDDEGPIVELLSMLLEDEGFRVTGHTSAPDAVATIRKDHPDLVVTDVMMPVMTGYELARKARSIDPGIRVVVMSAVIDASPKGRFPFVAKPFDLGKLLTVIDDELQVS
jgi:CheY-like chemotaxis protein